MVLFICGVKESGTNELVYKIETESQMWEIGIDIYPMLHIKEMTTKDLLIAQGTLLNTLMAYMGKESKEECIYVYV